MVKQLILATIKNEKTALLKILAIIIVLIIFTIVLYLKYNKKENWKNIHHDNDLTVSDILYYSITTCATVGFGDITSSSNETRIITMCMILTSYIIAVV